MILKKNHTADFQILGLSARGKTHRDQGLPNQDGLGYFTSRYGAFFATADGVGSCPKAHIGAQRILKICRIVLHLLMRRRLPFSQPAIAAELVRRWRAWHRPDTRELYATTLKAVFVCGGELAAVSVGDGALLLYDGQNVYRAEERPAGDFANETACFNRSIQAQEVQGFQIKCPRRFVLFLCTDGISSAMKDNQFSLFIQELYARKSTDACQRELENFITEIDKYNGDDKTAEVIYYGAD